MNALNSAMQDMHASLSSVMGETVAYTRGVNTLELMAVPGNTLFKNEDGFGSFAYVRSQDWIVPAAALEEFGEPERGDKIQQGSRIFEVASPGNEPHYREMDGGGTLLRIHTNRVA